MAEISAQELDALADAWAAFKNGGPLSALAAAIDAVVASATVMEVGCCCGTCGGPIYFTTCEVAGCVYAVASECQRCGMTDSIDHQHENES